MAREFQTHVDEMMREANLSEVRDQISAIRNFDIRGEMEQPHRSGRLARATLRAQSAGTDAGSGDHVRSE